MELRISIDDGPSLTRRARTVLIGNVGRLQGGVRLWRDAQPDDGLLEVAVIMPPTRRHWLSLAWALLRQQRSPATMEVFRALRIEVTSDRTHPRELDGDLIEPSHTLVATVRPAALWLCAPTTAPSPRLPSAAAAHSD